MKNWHNNLSLVLFLFFMVGFEIWILWMLHSNWLLNCFEIWLQQPIRIERFSWLIMVQVLMCVTAEVEAQIICNSITNHYIFCDVVKYTFWYSVFHMKNVRMKCLLDWNGTYHLTSCWSSQNAFERQLFVYTFLK